MRSLFAQTPLPSTLTRIFLKEIRLRLHGCQLCLYKLHCVYVDGPTSVLAEVLVCAKSTVFVPQINCTVDLSFHFLHGDATVPQSTDAQGATIFFLICPHDNPGEEQCIFYLSIFHVKI